MIILKKIIYYYNGKKIVGTKESELKEISGIDGKGVKYFIGGIEVSENIYKDVKSTIEGW